MKRRVNAKKAPTGHHQEIAYPLKEKDWFSLCLRRFVNKQFHEHSAGRLIRTDNRCGGNGLIRYMTAVYGVNR